MSKGMQALHKLVSHIETEMGSDDYYEVRCARDAIEEELSVLEILHKYEGWVGSLRYLLFKRNYWEQNKTKITNELLEPHDIPFTVDEFKTVTDWLKKKEAQK